jgi:hypothetical protein
MAGMTQAQYLLMLAEDARDKGDELIVEIRQRGAEHAREVASLSALIDQARDIIEREKARFSQYLPNRPESSLGSQGVGRLPSAQGSPASQGTVKKTAAE